MISIDRSGLIGKGRHRECYRHPENNHLCIKVVVAGGAKEGHRERRYYRHLKKRGICWDMIPEWHGDIETNLGSGSVFDLILNQDGSVSKTLEYYVSSNEKTEAHFDGLSRSLYLLKDYLLQQRIITMTLKPKNILCQKGRTGISRLFVVDNIGNSDFIPICNYSKYFAKNKIARRWKHFECSMLNKCGHNSALHRMLTSSHC